MRVMRWLGSLFAALVMFVASLWLFQFAKWSWLPNHDGIHWLAATTLAGVTALLTANAPWWAGKEAPPSAEPGSAGHGRRSVWLRARASGSSQIYQAGRDQNTREK
jgi:hypothetical protein